MTLKEIMTTKVEVISPDSKLKEAAERMAAFDFGALPVCDGGKLVGMITDRDIAIKSTARGDHPSQVSVREVMSSPVVYAFEDSRVEEAVRLMEVKQIRRLVVLNNDKRLVGIVALGDIAIKTGESLAGEALEKISNPTQRKAA